MNVFMNCLSDIILPGHVDTRSHDNPAIQSSAEDSIWLHADIIRCPAPHHVLDIDAENLRALANAGFFLNNTVPGAFEKGRTTQLSFTLRAANRFDPAFCSSLARTHNVKPRRG
jgi:hypothetical protein